MQHFQSAFFHLAQSALPRKFMGAPDLTEPGFVNFFGISIHDDA
jgi:hypothetical protein